MVRHHNLSQLTDCDETIQIFIVEQEAEIDTFLILRSYETRERERERRDGREREETEEREPRERAEKKKRGCVSKEVVMCGREGHNDVVYT
jgi:hypothetical protein